MTDISSCRRKEADGSQLASLLSNSLQQRGDKYRGLLWPDAFTKGAYSPAVLNAASRRKLTTDATVYSGAKSTKSWTTDQWSRVLFTDKSRFSTRSDSQRVLIWREIGTRGSVIGDRYCEEVLLPHVRLFRGAIGPDFIFTDENARPHQALAVEKLLESEDITRMDWPAYSPDLNPIERV
ncbi:transposable element Tcb2 transposase [Trichonephila clavipes]|nr:transposable element Tcb2 transposase [Trichonephila clavipes]